MSRPVGYRFVRYFDPIESRMMNVWFDVMSEESFVDQPRATELTIQARTKDEVVSELRRVGAKFLPPEIVEKVIAAKDSPKIAKEAVFAHTEA